MSASFRIVEDSLVLPKPADGEATAGEPLKVDMIGLDMVSNHWNMKVNSAGRWWRLVS
jgi:hypothetical protein